jgi:hypothetical protein
MGSMIARGDLGVEFPLEHGRSGREVKPVCRAGEADDGCGAAWADECAGDLVRVACGRTHLADVDCTGSGSGATALARALEPRAWQPRYMNSTTPMITRAVPYASWMTPTIGSLAKACMILRNAAAKARQPVTCRSSRIRSAP